MNLENFPTSETGKRMLETVSNGFYDNSYVGKWLFQVMGLEMGEAREKIEELPYQAFPETATWGLRYHEQKYGLPVREELDYEERRRFIYQKRDERSPMNPYRMEVIMENITSRKAHVDDESGPVNTFTIKLESGNNAVDVTAAIKKIKAIKQSHVAFTLRFTAVAHIELCGNVERYESRYPICGTVPGVSTGLRLMDAGVELSPETYPYKRITPMTGNSGEAGQYPKTSTGLKVAEGAVEAEIYAAGYQVDYPEASENMAAGSHPKTRFQAVYAMNETEVAAKLSGFKYQNEVAGTKPQVSTGLIQKKAATDIEASGKGTEVEYSLAGEKEAGTVPKVSTGAKESGESVIPEVKTESYQIRYPLCGNTFEI